MLMLSCILLDLSSTCFFFFNDTATTEIYTLSLHDALPICLHGRCDHFFSFEIGPSQTKAGRQPWLLAPGLERPRRASCTMQNPGIITSAPCPASTHAL